MSEVLTVPTHFNDIGELCEGFLDRVEQDTLILYGPVAYEDGSEIEFAVLLADGTPALVGTGRVRAAVDGGEDRVPETRYDVVVEALAFEGHYEVVFERLVLSRQAVSDPPEGVADEAVSVPPDEVFSLAPEDAEPVTVPPEEEAPDTVPPEAYDEDQDEDQDEDEDDEPATVIAAVDAEALMAETASEPPLASEPPQSEPVEPNIEDEYGSAAAAVIANASEAEIEIVGADGAQASEPAFEAPAPVDSMYAFEHGIAEEPKVGMPVPMPSMAAPPDSPPAPPTLRLAEPPEGLTRPSLAEPEDTLFDADGEISDVHTTGLFAYEDALPIPSRPPLPDPDGPAKKAAPVEAAGDYDVEDSDPQELLADEYEEVRLSDFAEAAEEG